MSLVVFCTVTPGAIFSASCRLVRLRSSISWLDSTDTDCGVSRRLVGLLEPTLTAPVVYEPVFSVISPMPWPLTSVLPSSSAAPPVVATGSSTQLPLAAWVATRPLPCRSASRPC
ncbi:hypothetical protein D3C80_1477520 [compost metagenome]